jgi:1,4-alpha-glucan branching enzyme
MAPDLLSVPTGATLVPGGATFRIWAPRAKSVFVSGDFNQWQQNAASQLQNIGGGHWATFIPGLKDGDQYLFFINGLGSRGFKRDPRARKLTAQPPFPQSNCVLRDPSRFPWHDTGFAPPAFNDLIIYQLHIGTFHFLTASGDGKFLDIINQLPYLTSLGVNAIQTLPVVEYPTNFSLGYNGTDYFSPESAYGEFDPTALKNYHDVANGLLRSRGLSEYTSIDVLQGSDNQLRAMVDLCHVFGIAVFFDLVYNHAGGGFDSNSMWFLDRMPEGNANDSLYFTDQGWAGGQVFAYWNNDVKQFLIDNAKFFYEEYRIDGYRFDEVSVMDQNGGWQTSQFLSDTLRAKKPEAVLIAEYWPVNGAVVNPVSDGGAGFDATWHAGIRDTVRAAIGQSTSGASAHVDMTAIANALAFPNLRDHWRAVQCIENHDIVYQGREPRIARLADSSNAHSWYARSRSRLGMGLLLTAPGIPMIFMGQEILEDKQWDDTPVTSDLIYWQGLNSGDKSMVDFLRFTQDLVSLRRRLPALRGEGVHVIFVSDNDRVLAFQRWVEGSGQDVVVVASLNESTYYNYQIGFPGPGRWKEVFNSDIYDNWVNPITAGNGGSIEASSGPLHGLAASASLVIPANGFVVFTRG